MNIFDTPDYFEPEALGEPGKRQFRLIAKQDATTVSLWLERAQLQELMETIQEIYVGLTGNMMLRKESDPLPKHEPRAAFPSSPDSTFQVGPMSLGVVEDTQNIIFQAAPLELIEINGEETINEDAEPEFRVTLSSEMVAQFIIFAEQTLASGRPRCPNCGQALEYSDEPHVCVKKNGHHHID